MFDMLDYAYFLLFYQLYMVVAGNPCVSQCNTLTMNQKCFQRVNNISYCLCDDLYLCQDYIHKCERDISTTERTNTTVEDIEDPEYFFDYCVMKISCPLHYDDEPIRQLCETISSEPLTTDMFPVSVEESGFPIIHFRNKFCAVCNEKTNYTIWDVGVDLETCDIFKIMTLRNGLNLQEASRILTNEPGCSVIPVSSHPPCSICQFIESVNYYEGFPVLAALLNFNPDLDLGYDDSEPVECDKYQAGTCAIGQIMMEGNCETIFSVGHPDIHQFRLFKQMTGIYSENDTQSTAEMYISFFKGLLLNSIFRDTLSMLWWESRTHYGETEIAEGCTEIELVIIVRIYEYYTFVPDIIEKILPCEHSSAAVACFVPESSPNRDMFCNVQLCSKGGHTSGDLNVKVQSVMTLVSLSLSVFCLLTSVAIFAKCPVFDNLPGKINLSLILSILVAQVLYISNAIFYKLSLACKIIGVISHYSWLCSFGWMSVCAIHTWYIFGRSSISGSMHSSEERVLLIRYSIGAVLFPLAIVLPCLLCDHLLDNFSMGYGHDICFITNTRGIIIGFAAPVGFTLILNCALFVATVINIQRGSNIANNVRTTRDLIKVYVKLSSLMGLTWILAYIAEIMSISSLETASILINGLQGVFIFVSFVCNKRVFKWLHGVFFPSPESTS